MNLHFRHFDHTWNGKKVDSPYWFNFRKEDYIWPQLQKMLDTQPYLVLVTSFLYRAKWDGFIFDQNYPTGAYSPKLYRRFWDGFSEEKNMTIKASDYWVQCPKCKIVYLSKSKHRCSNPLLSCKKEVP